MMEHYPPEIGERTSPPRQADAAPRKHSWAGWVWLVILALVGFGAYSYIHRRGRAGPAATTGQSAAGRGRGGAVTPVVAVKALKGNIGVYLSGLGTVTPIYTVVVKSRVDGQLMKVNYREGDYVHEGDPLVEIDPRPFQVQLMQAEGQFGKDQAALDNAQLDLTRYQTLLTHNAIPEQQLATQKALVEQDAGAVKTDQATVANAKLNIAYCHITAPITGRIGLRLVDPGNYVQAGSQSGLLVITQVRPISVIFTIPEDQVPAVLQKLRHGARLRVDAYSRDMGTQLATGSLTTVDNQIDPTTGTLRLRATFNNSDDALFPNQFVNARLLVEQKRGVTLVPNAVVQRNTEMAYVYLVKPDSTVTIRKVAVGTTEEDQTEISSGLTPGDVVVMTGVDKLQEGSKVRAHFENETASKAQ
ncbi:MAG TPA: MdtA/MuxA family multidrug efflux RND transporter periplasmic adaptor subunit [Terriglobia bacterium]|nr:MdtA/MuxA family multidrug efflux RND transporter periplasmic adaptor subunit [Terriglobia bacterium]